MSTVTRPTIGSPANLRAKAEAAVRELQQRLWSIRRSMIGQRMGTGLLLILAIVALCLIASATADWALELSTAWRGGWMVVVLTSTVIVAAIGWRRWISTYTLSDAAADTERQLVQFGQRLRTTLDYEQQQPRPAAASPALLNSLHNETQTLVQQTEWNDAIDSRPLWRSAMVASTVALGWLGALVMVPEFRIATARAMLLPFEYTTVTYSPDQATIRPGESVTFNAIVSGRPIEAATIRYRTVGSEKWETVALLLDNGTETEATSATPAPVPLVGELTATLSNITQDVELEVIAGPRPLPKGYIRVLQPLTLQKAEVRITPPEYTRRPIETVESLSLKVLEGSNVEIKFELNRPAAEAKLLRQDRTSAAASEFEPAEIPLHLQDNFAFTALGDLRKNANYTVSARTADGMSLDPVPVSIRVQPDRKAEVVFVEPPEELVVTPSTEVPIIVEAKDDLGLYKVGVMFQVGSNPMQTLVEEDLDGSQDPSRVAKTLLLEDFGLTHQDAVTYFAFAEDNYFGQPRRTITPLRFIDIRPYKLSFQVVESNCPPCNGSSVTLEELITRQRQGLTQAFQASQQSPVKEVTSKLSEAQEELLDATVEFAEGMAARGADLPSLKEAIKHMETAIEALDAVDASAAVPAEQSALAELIRARENLRKILKQSNSQSSSACRNFDRQQRQKLRMPEKKKTDQQQQLADARKKLDDLAKKERQWSQQASRCCSSSSSSSSGKPSQSKPSDSKPSDSKPSQSENQQEQNSDQQKSEAAENEGSKSPTPDEVAAAQEKLQAELAELQQQLQKLNSAGQAARDQADQAAESMKQGLAELKNKQGEAAAREGERAAKQLEQLSEHLAAMNARDFGQRLDQAQKLAQQLASRQESIEKQVGNQSGSKDGKPSDKAGQSSSDSKSNSGQKPNQESGTGSEGDSQRVGNGSKGSQELAREQEGLATQTGLLADLLDTLQRDARKETGGVQQKLEQAQAENPPREIAAGMRQTAEDLQADRKGAAGRGATQARQSLLDLSKALGAARTDYAQPQLKELMALEEQLAQLQQQMKRAQNKSDDPSASLSQKWEQLEPRLDRLASADPRVAEALRELREGKPAKPGTESGTATPQPGSKIRPSEFRNGGGEVPEGFYSWLELGDSSGVREVSKVLQTKIQEAILAGALMDADQPVPPAYKELVEKYYRALSDDLR